MYQIITYIPENHVEIVKTALFEAGAGTVGNYSCCSWQTIGEGQYMPLKGSNAFIGSIDNLEMVTEYKVETICNEEHIKAVIAALKKSHPYEEPAYHVIRCEDF